MIKSSIIKIANLWLLQNTTLDVVSHISIFPLFNSVHASHCISSQYYHTFLSLGCWSNRILTCQRPSAITFERLLFIHCWDLPVCVACDIWVAYALAVGSVNWRFFVNFLIFLFGVRVWYVVTVHWCMGVKVEWNWLYQFLREMNEAEGPQSACVYLRL